MEILNEVIKILNLENVFFFILDLYIKRQDKLAMYTYKAQNEN